VGVSVGIGVAVSVAVGKGGSVGVSVADGAGERAEGGTVCPLPQPAASARINVRKRPISATPYRFGIARGSRDKSHLLQHPREDKRPSVKHIIDPIFCPERHVLSNEWIPGRPRAANMPNYERVVCL
jgi:hypothetical protein